MAHYDDIKESAVARIASAFDKAGNEMGSIENDISNMRAKLSDATLQYTNLMSEMARVRAEAKDERERLDKESLELAAAKAAFAAEVGKFHESRKELKADIDGLVGTRDILTKQIDALKKEVEGLENMRKIKDSIEDEIKAINGKLLEKRDELRDTENKVKEIISDAQKQKSIAEADLKKLLDEIAAAKKVVLPKLNELTLKENELNEREANIAIIIERYKKLYAEKGAGFKI